MADISKNIFQFCKHWTSDKLFRTDFIRSKNLRFQNSMKSNDVYFIYNSLCYAKAITIIRKRLIIKTNDYKNTLFINMNEETDYLFLAIDKIKLNLEKNGLFKLVKESFFKWVLSLFIIYLKTSDQETKIKIYKILHKKFNQWDNFNNYPKTSNIYSALYYIKHQKVFPTINIAYYTNQKLFNQCLVSILSLLINSEYENINIIVLYNNITQKDIRKLNEFKKIRYFTFEAIYTKEKEFNIYPLDIKLKKEIFYKYSLADMFKNIDKIIYIDSDTIIKKSLLPLWEINLNNKLFAFFEDICLYKCKVEKRNLYIIDKVFLINFNELRVEKNLGKNINFKKKIKILNHKLNYIIDWSKSNSCQYNNKNLELDNNNEPSKNSYENEFLKYNKIKNNLKRIYLTIPIVLASDNKYAPYMYTTILSILENANKKTFYVFYLLVSLNFTKVNQNLILKLNYQFKCNIHFVFIKNEFKYIIPQISHISTPTYYRLLVGDILPEEFDKCIYLDVDICVSKDLSELYNIDLKDNYIAGVVAAGYYFLEKINCKRLNISSMKQYLNAGMLLMNLNKIRKDNMTKKFLDLSKRNYQSQDQDVLNVACYGKIITLPPKFNAMVERLRENNPLLKNLYSETEINEANKNPYIIHYAASRKPWNSIGVYMEKYWWNIVKKTPYINNIFDKNCIYKKEIEKWWLLNKKKIINIDNPKTFNEKIQWLKIFDSTPKKAYLSDKYLVRIWIKNKIGEKYLIPLIGIYNKLDEINFENLPKSFVIKCNHCNEHNIIVKDKSKLNMTEIKFNLYRWINENNAFKNNDIELQYLDIQDKIIIEHYMNEEKDNFKNYKFHCSNGKPIFIENYIDHKYIFYDLKSNKISYIPNKIYLSFHSQNITKLLGKMIELSSILSEGFSYARIDFFIFHGKIYFNKISFSSLIDSDEYYDRKFGSYIKLPKEIYNIDTGEYYEIKKSF